MSNAYMAGYYFGKATIVILFLVGIAFFAKIIANRRKQNKGKEGCEKQNDPTK